MTNGILAHLAFVNLIKLTTGCIPELAQILYNYNLTHDGQGYEQKTNIAFPSEVLLSGLAYHSQIENDMLRLNIGTIPEDGSAQALYSPAPRIVKSFPRGYDFSERSFVVEIILQNFTNKVLTWPDNASGAKLIDSLYAPHKDVA